MRTHPYAAKDPAQESLIQGGQVSMGSSVGWLQGILGTGSSELDEIYYPEGAGLCSAQHSQTCSRSVSWVPSHVGGWCQGATRPCLWARGQAYVHSRHTNVLAPAGAQLSLASSQVCTDEE